MGERERQREATDTCHWRRLTSSVAGDWDDDGAHRQPSRRQGMVELQYGSVGASGKGQILQAGLCAGALACDQACGLGKGTVE